MYIPRVQHLDAALPGARIEASGAVPLLHVPASAASTSSSSSTSYDSSNVWGVTIIHHHILAWFISSISSCLLYVQDAIISPLSGHDTAPASNSKFDKRADDPSPNTTTGVVVGVLLSAFVIGVGGFFYVYGKRLRFKKRRRRRHHNRGSKSSESSDASAAAAAGAAAGGGDPPADGGEGGG